MSALSPADARATTTISLLVNQHRALLAHLADLEAALDGADAEYHLLEFAVYLECEATAHLRVEEEALLPLLARHFGITQGPLAMMHAEHRRFRSALWDLGAAVQARNIRAQRAEAVVLIQALREHISKEERVIFPLAESLLNESERDEMDARAASLGALQGGNRGSQSHD